MSDPNPYAVPNVVVNFDTSEIEFRIPLPDHTGHRVIATIPADLTAE